MRIREIVTESLKTDNPCWKGYHPVGTKKKNGKTVPNCVPKESVEEGSEQHTQARLWKMITAYEKQARNTKNDIKRDHLLRMADDLRSQLKTDDQLEEAGSPAQQAAIAISMKKAGKTPKHEESMDEDWQSVNRKDKTDGMSKKAVNAYRREHPGSKLKTAVTTKPSKLKKGGKAAKRRSSYCSRSAGQKKMHHIDCSKTPDKAICKARRRWNCESISLEETPSYLQNIMKYARSHYGDTANDIEATLQFLARSVMHAKQDDEVQYKIINKIKSDLMKLSNRIDQLTNRP